MQIYILRHGKSESVSSDGSDAGRELTFEGRQSLQAVLRRARAARIAPDLIVTSPFVRAVQTAELACEMLGHGGLVERNSALVPSASPYDIWEELRLRRKEMDQVLLVGHQPLVGHLIAFLLDSPSLEVEVVPAALTAIREESTGPKPRGVLRWILSPDLSA